MAKLIPAAERVTKARKKIQEARDLPVPAVGGKFDFGYVVKVKSLLKEARELVQLIPKTVGISEETKKDAQLVIEEAAQADKDIFH